VSNYFQTLDIILGDKPDFLAEVPPRVFQQTVGLPRSKYGPDYIVLERTPSVKLKVLKTGRTIQLNVGKRRDDGDGNRVGFNPRVMRKCLRLRDCRLRPGRVIYDYRVWQHEAAYRKTKKVKKREARARLKGQALISPTKRASPLKQVWTQETMNDVYDNTDPWTVTPGESLLYSDYRPAYLDDDDSPVRWDSIEQDPVMLLDEADSLATYEAQEQAPTSTPPSSLQEVPGVENGAPATTSTKRRADDEEQPEQPRKKQRKASEDAKESPTREQPQALTSHEPGEQIASSTFEQTQPQGSVITSTIPFASQPQPNAGPSSKKRKASDDLEEVPAKRQRDSPEPDRQLGSPQVLSSLPDTPLGDSVNNFSPFNSPTVDKQHKHQELQQPAFPALTGSVTDASPRSSSTDNHEIALSLTTAQPPSTAPSSFNSKLFCNNQQTGKAPPPSRIWFRSGWSCNLH